MRNKNLLLVIDMQNDFCLPEGALYVQGAGKDVTNLGRFIEKNVNEIDNIILTQDNHHVIDISHPGFWVDKNGNHPEPYTLITEPDVKNGLWIPYNDQPGILNYLRKLEEQHEFQHVIWPEHCLAGTNGAAFADELMQKIIKWTRTGKFYNVIRKGLNPLTEHFGALRANIPINTDPATLPDRELINTLESYQHIFIAGEAKSHCVANTIKQIMELTKVTNRLIILEDAMSDVTGFEGIATPVYKKALEMGAQIKTTDLQLN